MNEPQAVIPRANSLALKPPTPPEAYQEKIKPLIDLLAADLNEGWRPGIKLSRRLTWPKLTLKEQEFLKREFAQEGWHLEYSYRPRILWIKPRTTLSIWSLQAFNQGLG